MVEAGRPGLMVSLMETIHKMEFIFCSRHPLMDVVGKHSLVAQHVWEVRSKTMAGVRNFSEDGDVTPGSRKNGAIVEWGK